MIIPQNTFLSRESIILTDGTIIDTLKAKPYLIENIVKVKSLGGITEAVAKSLSLSKGINTRDIHDYNVLSGAIESDEDTRAAESKRVSESRLRSKVRELAACNDWDYFLTITLAPEKWNRINPDGLQKTIHTVFRRWKRKQVGKQHPYRDCAYLIVPELQAVHLHGLARHIPPIALTQYTIKEVESNTPLPSKICDAVRKGKSIYHCENWDNEFGYNTLEPVRDHDRCASYITKYITKTLNCDVFKTRIWHTRGLSTATVIATFQLPSGEKALDEYRSFMESIAAVTQDGIALNTAYYYNDKLASVKTIINRETMSASEVSRYLSLRYNRID